MGTQRQQSLPVGESTKPSGQAMQRTPSQGPAAAAFGAVTWTVAKALSATMPARMSLFMKTSCFDLCRLESLRK
jgi:hypothetical protein